MCFRCARCVSVVPDVFQGCSSYISGVYQNQRNQLSWLVSMWSSSDSSLVQPGPAWFLPLCWTSSWSTVVWCCSIFSVTSAAVGFWLYLEGSPSHENHMVCFKHVLLFLQLHIWKLPAVCKCCGLATVRCQKWTQRVSVVKQSERSLLVRLHSTIWTLHICSVLNELNDTPGRSPLHVRWTHTTTTVMGPLGVIVLCLISPFLPF